MSSARITVDGLWRCLCPSIDAVALSTAISRPYRPRPASRLSAKTTCAGPRVAPRRHLHTTPPKLQDDSAQKKEEPIVGLTRSETKEAKDVAPKSTDFGDRTPAVKFDQEAAKAWRGYFDVMLVEDTEERQDNNSSMSNQPVEDLSPEVVDAEAQQQEDTVGVISDAEKEGRHDLSPSSRNIGEQSLPAFSNVDAEKDPFDDLFGPEEKQYGLFKPNDFGEGSSPVLTRGGDDKDVFNALSDAEDEQQRKLPKFDDLEEDPSTMVAVAGAEQVSLDGFPAPEERQQAGITGLSDFGIGSSSMVDNPGSTASRPANRETMEATQVVDGVHEVPSALTRGESRSTRTVYNEMADRILQMKPPFKDIPPGAEREDILKALSLARMRGPRKYRRIIATLLKHLLSIDPKPTAFYYDLLFRAHSSPEGSADTIASLLKEMRQERIHWSSVAYHSVLRALAVHPDYLMRNVIIREMKERWIEIMPKGHRYIAIGLLRDEQYELALEKLEQMIHQGIEVNQWVFDIFIYVFGKLEFLDDALRLVRHRLDRGFEVSVNTWYFLLDISSKAQNHEATTYIWNRTVQQGIVNPSDGVALNILNMASVYGDTDLATQVIQYLAERGTRLSRPHYEALADAYSMQGNVERAIEVYCIMHGAGAEVSHASAGALCQSLSRDPSRIDDAVKAMAELKKKYKLPVGVFNAVLNEMVKSSAVAPEEAFLKALGLYRRVREFLPSGPNWETFRNLLWRCTKPDIAQFLAAEMIGFNIRQNLVIMELMFKVNVEHNGPIHRLKSSFYKVAPHLHSDYATGSRRWQNIMDLSVKLVKRLIAERDPEAWRILDICRQNGLEQDRIVALRKEVEAGRIASVDSPNVSDVPEGQRSGLRQS